MDYWDKIWILLKYFRVFTDHNRSGEDSVLAVLHVMVSGLYSLIGKWLTRSLSPQSNHVVRLASQLLSEKQETSTPM